LKKKNTKTPSGIDKQKSERRLDGHQMQCENLVEQKEKEQKAAKIIQQTKNKFKKKTPKHPLALANQVRTKAG
jgi:hypothetical protein